MTERSGAPGLVGRLIVWAVGSTLGLVIGLLLSFTLVFAASGPRGPGAALAIIGALVAGFAIGLGQFAVLSLWKRPTLSARWLWVTGVGFAVTGFLLLGSDAVVNVGDRALGAIQVGGAGLAALLTMVAQWAALRDTASKAWWWPAAGAVSLAAAGLLAVLGADSVTAMWVGWILYAALGGGAMARLLPPAA